MADPVAFYRNASAQAKAFVEAFEAMKLIADRIGTDSFLSAAAATAAQAAGRTDLAAADFDNLKAGIDLVTALMNTTSTQSVTNNVNTGGKAVLAFYKML